MPGSREISFVLRSRFDDADGERGRIVRLDVGPDIVWDMLPNPLSRRSIISPEALDDLRVRGLVPERTGTWVPLRDLRIADQPVPDLDVRVSAAMTRLRVDGILGLDSFEQFDLVRWHPRTHRVTLVLP